MGRAQGLAAALACAAALASGCAYSFGGSGLPSHIKTLAVPTFANDSLEPDLGSAVSTAVADGFTKDGKLKLASDTSADARLEGSVVSYENRVHNYSGGAPTDYIVVVKLKVKLRDQVKNRELWADDALVATAVYAPGGSAALTSEEAARQKAIADLSQDIVTRTVEQW